MGFSGLTLRPTAHGFIVGEQELYTWCAWGTLFLPALLDATASVLSVCPLTGTAIELVVAPSRVASTSPDGVHLSFPSPAATDPADITGSFCCHVVFLAGADAARDWRARHPDGLTLDLDTSHELGIRAIARLLAVRPWR